MSITIHTKESDNAEPLSMSPSDFIDAVVDISTAVPSGFVLIVGIDVIVTVVDMGACDGVMIGAAEGFVLGSVEGCTDG